MKKLISIMLVLVLAAGTFAIAGCANNENSSSDQGSDSSDQSSKLEKAKVSKFEAYLTYDPEKYIYDKDLLELFYKDDENKYIYGAVFDETELKREKEQFEGRAGKTNLKEVSYGELKLNNFDSKTVTYKSNGNYSKEYFIVFDEKIGGWAAGAKLFSCLGADKSFEPQMDELAKTLEVNPERKTEDQ